MSQDINDKILTYAEDGDFIHWVNSGFKHNNSYWKDILGDPSKEEEVNAAIEIVQAMQFDIPATDSSRKSALFDSILEDIDDTEEQIVLTPQRKTRRLWPLLAAASVALLVFLLLPDFSASQFNTSLAEHTNITFPDNSSAELNAESVLSFDKKAYGSERIIKLDGEAFFEVKKGNQFRVETQEGYITVLGTSFNVYARDERLEVYCRTGKVKVSNSEGSDEKILEPGQSCVLESGNFIDYESARNGEWRNGIFNFSEQNLSEVLEEIERQFDVDVQMDKGISDISYTGFFESGDMDKALQSVLWPLGLRFQIKDDGGVVISQN